MADEQNQPENIRNAELIKEVHALRTEVARVNSHRYIKMHDSLWKLGAFQLFRGLAFGLGSVLGATLLVSILLQVLASMDFIPVLGEWVTQIIEQIGNSAN